MKTYGFPWPDMLKCDKFPPDNDMCITPQSIANSTEGETSFIITITIKNKYTTVKSVFYALFFFYKFHYIFI